MAHRWVRTRVTNIIPAPEPEIPDGQIAIFLAQREDGVPFYASIFFRNLPDENLMALEVKIAQQVLDEMIDEEHPDLVQNFGDWFNAPIIWTPAGVVLSELSC